MQVGDRVYDKQHNAHGYVVDLDESNTPPMAKVQYFWGKYSRMFPPRRIWQKATPDKQKWVEVSSLILTPKPNDPRNKVTMFGTRSLDKLIRLITEIPHRQWEDGSDIIIHYGNGHSYSGDALIINANPIWNKYEQCKLLHGLTPDILPNPDDGMEGDWIVKPFSSIGGKGIADWNGDNHHGKYLQKKVKKVREFRAHCFLWADNQVPLIQEKMIDDRSQLCWNKKQGGKFHYVYQPILERRELDSELVNRIKTMAIDACKRLKYDFGGVDIALDDNDELFIFEINSRMGLREMSFATYKNVLWQLYNLDIDDYKATRWQPTFSPVVDQIFHFEGTPTIEERAAQTMTLKGCTEEYHKMKYQSFNLADREVSIG